MGLRNRIHAVNQVSFSLKGRREATLKFSCATVKLWGRPLGCPSSEARLCCPLAGSAELAIPLSRGFAYGFLAKRRIPFFHLPQRFFLL